MSALQKEDKMNIETSKKILKIAGILSIIGGVIGILVGILATAGGGILAGLGEAEDQGEGAMVAVVGVIVLIAGIVSLIEGIFSTRAAKDTSKIKPAWIFAIIGLVTNGISFVSGIINGGGSAGSGIVSVAFSVLIFIAANSIKKEEGI